ncbi:MAG: N-6 DNA methylase [Deltaproteobacteria bacterium]|nr:N-6 DNA methylase [Deltaproteobacteria bacterium]
MSSYGLNSETKKAVKSVVLELRELLEGEFDPNTGEPIPPGGDISRQLSRYGIYVNKPESLKSESAPEYLTDEEKKKRERICAAIKREVSIFGKLSERAALRRGMRSYIRQTCYTWINRLLGLRCMEARGLLKDEQGEPDYVVTPFDDYGGLPRRAWLIKGKNPENWQTAKLYDLQCEAIADACRQLTREIKVLFDPEHDHGLIWPSPSALNTILRKIQELDKSSTPSPFTSPDFLGWVYQYFQTKEKDQVFEAASKKKKKIEKDDIIPVTQIYTEHYMVEYLVQNSLGRLWMEMHPDSKLCENWAYYVKPPEENPPIERELKKAIEIKLMDPAVGSGHFHLVAFDLLLDMYKEELENTGQPGWPDVPSVQDKKDIPAAILDHNLFGIDIDARSIQLASLVLVMKARESGYEGSINHLNLVVANSAPFESDAWFQFIQNLEENGKHSVARVLAALGIQLKNLDEFGSLLRIEDEMQQIIQEEKKQWIAQAEAGKGQMNLFPELEKPKQQGLPFEQEITDETFFDRLGPVIEKELDAFYQKARQDGLAEEAIMAADAERGFDFARFSMQRYDVVYTNPPYMGSKNMGDRLKKFVAKAYPQGKRDLYAAFILRCIELSRQNGYVGMVTQQSWMFLRSFVNLRALPEEKLKKAKDRFQGLLRESTIETIAHLGPRAFAEISGEVVNIVLFTLRNLLPKPEHMITAYRLIGPKSSSEKANALAKRKPQDAFSVKQSAFLNITESPLAWIPMESKGPNAAGERTASLTIGHANICYVYN